MLWSSLTQFGGHIFWTLNQTQVQFRLRALTPNLQFKVHMSHDTWHVTCLSSCTDSPSELSDAHPPALSLYPYSLLPLPPLSLKVPLWAMSSMVTMAAMDHQHGNCSLPAFSKLKYITASLNNGAMAIDIFWGQRGRIVICICRR